MKLSMQHRIFAKCPHFVTVQDDNCDWGVSGMHNWLNAFLHWEAAAANHQITHSFCYKHLMFCVLEKTGCILRFALQINLNSCICRSMGQNPVWHRTNMVTFGMTVACGMTTAHHSSILMFIFTVCCALQIKPLSWMKSPNLHVSIWMKIACNS